MTASAWRGLLQIAFVAYVAIGLAWGFGGASVLFAAVAFALWALRRALRPIPPYSDRYLQATARDLADDARESMRE